MKNCTVSNRNNNPDTRNNNTLELGSTLCLGDELTPGICRHPTGRFCVLMPMRVTIPAEIHAETCDPPQQPAKVAA